MSEPHKNTKNGSLPFYYKLLSILSVVRGYNIIAIVIAQYLASIFIFSPQKSLRLVLLNKSLFFIVLATICTIAAGYIINNFYDKEKDKINKPLKTKLDDLVSQKTKLGFYFTLNFIGVLFGYLVSYKASIFFAVYIFLIWFYSHKLKKYPLLGLLSAAILALLPFFAIFVFYKNFSEIIFIHAFFLFFVLLIKELIKDLENIKGDLLQNYVTIPIKYSEKFAKKIIVVLSLLTVIPIYFVLTYEEVGNMRYYFYFAFVVILVIAVLVWLAKNKLHYIILHNMVKLLIVVGILSLMLIDTSVIIKRLL